MQDVSTIQDGCLQDDLYKEHLEADEVYLCERLHLFYQINVEIKINCC